MRTFLHLLLVSVAAVALGACGGSSSSSTSDAGSLQHLDGTLQVTGGGVELTVHGEGARAFATGSSVQPAVLQALAASGSMARVTWRSDEPKLAIAVAAAPKVGEGLDSYVGTISAVSGTSITLTGESGARTFSISAKDRDAFDVTHLREHKADRESIRVYYDHDAPDAGVAYEDT